MLQCPFWTTTFSVLCRFRYVRKAWGWLPPQNLSCGWVGTKAERKGLRFSIWVLKRKSDVSALLERLFNIRTRTDIPCPIPLVFSCACWNIRHPRRWELCWWSFPVCRRSGALLIIWVNQRSAIACREPAEYLFLPLKPPVSSGYYGYDVKQLSKRNTRSDDAPDTWTVSYFPGSWSIKVDFRPALYRQESIT